MKLLLILFISNVESFFVANHNTNWSNFKKVNSKNYLNYFEERKRFLLWEQNANLIEAHNLRLTKGLETFKMELNFFSDLSNDEINNLFTGAKILLNLNHTQTSSFKKETINFVQAPLKSSVDYRNTILVGSIKNQGACG